MLEVCPSIAGEGKALLDVLPLSIGKKDDPARLIFNAKAGPAVNASLIDMGNRFRLIVSELDVIDPPPVSYTHLDVYKRQTMDKAAQHHPQQKIKGNDMKRYKQLEVWFVVGSQFLYGPKTLQEVSDNAQQLVAALNTEGGLPVRLVLKPTVKTPEEILAVCREANNAASCIGIVTWLHTFSPAKMWIAGLSVLEKPLMQFHTQFLSLIHI